MRQAQMIGKPFCGHPDGFNEGSGCLQDGMEQKH